MMNYQQRQQAQNSRWYITQKLNNLWQSFNNFLSKALFEDSEICVQKTIDSNGNPQWYVYNSTTQRSAYLYSEAEVVDWIEQSHYPTTDGNKQYWFFPGSSTLRIISDEC